MLTVCCLLVKGPVPYDADYVVRLERMVRRNLDRDFRFVCLTDQPETLPADIDRIAIPPTSMDVPANGRGYWRKLEVFNRSRGLTEGRILYIDLDSLVVDDLSPIVDFPAGIALTEDAFIEERAHLNTDRYGRTLVRRFNGSVMVWDGGTQDYLFDRWTLADTARLSSDQDWIGEQAVDAKPIPYAWFPRISQLVKDEAFAAVGEPMPADAKVVLVKKPKCHIAADKWPWFEPLWGAA